jgi:hypothetical protein
MAIILALAAFFPESPVVWHTNASMLPPVNATPPPDYPAGVLSTNVDGMVYNWPPPPTE